MARCDYCGREVYLPYKCKFCGGHFCPEHHLPENHDCPGLKAYKSRPKRSIAYLPSPTRAVFEAEGVKRPITYTAPTKAGFPVRTYRAYTAKRKAGRALKALALVAVLAVVGWLAYRHLAPLLIPGYITMTPVEIQPGQPTSGGEVDIVSPPQVYTPISIEELTKNPERYVGKRVAVVGVLDYAVPNPFSPAVEPVIAITYILMDEQGYYIPIKEPREQRAFFRGSVYEAKGVWKRIRVKVATFNPKRPYEYRYFYFLDVEEMVRKG